MYKIKYLPTGNIFVIPANTANELKKSYPDEYQILEKDGKKCKDRVKVKASNSDPRCIRAKVTEG